METPPSGMTTNSKSEDLENESLSLLIPDVQTTSMLVHKAVDRYRWEHLKIDGSSSDVDGHGQGSVEELQSTEERYSSVMMPLQFGKFLDFLHRFSQGSVERKVNSAIHRIVIFSNFLNMFSDW